MFPTRGAFLSTLALTLASACGARTELYPVTNDGDSLAEGDAGTGMPPPPYCSIEDGPVYTKTQPFTGPCPPSMPYCVLVPGMALFGCCPTPQGQPEGCLAP